MTYKHSMGTGRAAVGLALVTWTMAHADGLKLLRSEPADGATDVAVGVGVVRLTFNQDMRTDSFTVWKSPQGQFPPVNKEVESRWTDARTFELPIQRLTAGAEYFIQLNAEQRQGFRSTRDEALPITTIRFKTAADKSAGRQDIYDPSAERPAASRPATAVTTRPAEGECLLKWNAQIGQVCKMTQTTRVRLDLTVSAGDESQRQTLDTLTKAQYTDTFLAVEAGLPTRIQRRIDDGQVTTRNPDTGEMEREELPYKGLSVEARTRSDGGFELVSVEDGDRTAADEMIDECRWYTLEPGRAVKVGESWSLTGTQLAIVLGGLNAREGEITMRLARVAKDPQLAKDVAHLEGRIKAQMELPGGITPRLEGTLAVDFVPDVGLPFLRQCKAKLRVDQVIENEGQRVKVVGGGEVEIVEERAVSKDGGPRSVTDDSARGTHEATRPEPARERSKDQPAQTKKRLGTVAFDRRPEPNERAFTLLVPQGWRIGGGIVRVNPLTTGAVTQAVAAKCDMVIKKDDPETVGVHFLPTLMYADLTGMPAEGAFPPGSNYSGCPVVRRMSAEDFLAQGLFPRLRPAAQDVRVTERKKLPEMAAAYKRRIAELPMLGGMFEFDVALVTIEYTEGSTHYCERLFTVLKYYPQILWDNNDTLSFRAPLDQFEMWEPLARIIIYSVQFNSTWVQQEIRGQAERAGIILRTQQEIARIEQEIVAHRQKTNAEINNDMYLTLTGQEEYVNPYTNEVERDSGDWKYRWVTEGGQILFTDNEDYNPNIDPDRPFNRSDFKRSQVRPRFPQ